MNKFAAIVIAALSLVLSGCETIVEATKSSLSGIKVSSPLVERFGHRAEDLKLVLKNRHDQVGELVINGETTDVKIYPNETLTLTSSFEPFQTAQVSIIIIFYSPESVYSGHTEHVFDVSRHARSESWTFFSPDVVCFGKRLSESLDAPEFEPRTKQFRLPREWFYGTGRVSLVNDTPGKLITSVDGSDKTGKLAPGETYTVRTRDYSDSRWSNRQPVIVQAEAWDKNERYLGIYEFKFYPPSDGSHAQVIPITSRTLQHR